MKANPAGAGAGAGYMKANPAGAGAGAGYLRTLDNSQKEFKYKETIKQLNHIIQMWNNHETAKSRDSKVKQLWNIFILPMAVARMHSTGGLDGAKENLWI